jgi:hypothetical protein
MECDRITRNREGTMEHEEGLVTGREVVAALGRRIGYSTLLRMAVKGKVPYYEVGETGKRFRIREVLAAMRRPSN